MKKYGKLKLLYLFYYFLSELMVVPWIPDWAIWVWDLARIAALSSELAKQYKTCIVVQFRHFDLKIENNFQLHGTFLLTTELCFYSLSRKTVNARENFWNVYCFTTNQMRDETAKDNPQTAEWINHGLKRNSELAFSSTGNL